MAAIREVCEETGLNVTGRLTRIVQYKQPWAQHHDTLFTAKVTGIPGLQRPGGLLSWLEISDVAWFSPDNRPRLNREAELALRQLDTAGESHMQATGLDASRSRSARREVLRFGLGALTLAALLALISLFASGAGYGWTRRLLLSAVGLVAVASYITYWDVSLRVHTFPDPPEPNHEPPNHNKVTDYAAALLKELDLGQVTVFFDAIVHPTYRFERITESVEPVIRSVQVRTSYTFQDPPATSGRVVALPLVLQRRGALMDGLMVTNGAGERVSTVGRSMTIALEVAIIRFVLDVVSAEALTLYIRDIEKDVIDFLSASQPQPPFKVTTLATRIRGLPSTEKTKPLLQEVSRLLRRLTRLYPILVLTDCASSKQGSGLIRARRRFTVERLVAPSYITESQAGVAGRLNILRDGIRQALGIHPAVVSHPLTNADRAASYHLQIRGPVGTYLARQRIAEYPSGDDANVTGLDYVLRPRRGQRVAHLYVRSSSELLPDEQADIRRWRSLYLYCGFFERMPGSLGNATMSALGAAVLIAIGGFIKLDADVTSTDVVAVLLAFPAVASTWLGLENGRRLFGGVLMARVSLLTTIVVALISSVYYALGPASTNNKVALLSRPGAEIWSFLIGAAGVNLLACIGGWLLRARVEWIFTRRKGDAIDDLEA